MPRFLWICCLSVLLSACAAKTASRSADSAPLLESSSAAASSDQFWIVQPFDEKEGWRPASVEARNWGGHLAKRVQHYLNARDLEAKAAEHKLSEADLRAEMQKGLRYLCQGQIRSLTVESGNATLDIVYRLDRRMGDNMKPVQVRPLKVSASAVGSVSTTQVEALMDSAAMKIAERIVTDIPSDLVSERG